MNVSLEDVRGVSCAVGSGRLYGARDDTVILRAKGVAAGVTTRSTAAAAPCRWTRARVPGPVEAVVINAGNANAATGIQGERDTVEMAERVAAVLNCDMERVLVCSTGVIGVPLPMQKIRAGLEDAFANPNASGTRAAHAIMTTDTRPKEAGETCGPYRVAGIAKGSGMIHPNMATMLAFIFTDAPFKPEDLQSLLETTVEQTFNAISVDGDMSTNDTVLLISTADLAHTPAMDRSSEVYAQVADGVGAVCRQLAQSIARDGEGAEHLIAVHVKGLSTDEAARAAAKSVVSSNLVKAAIQGRDPNWGRIIGALGAAGVPGLDQCTVTLCDVPVLASGLPQPFDEPALKARMASDEIEIEIRLNEGHGEGTAWGCDLSEEYVKINADYRS